MIMNGNQVDHVRSDWGSRNLPNGRQDQTTIWKPCLDSQPLPCYWRTRNHSPCMYISPKAETSHSKLRQDSCALWRTWPPVPTGRFVCVTRLRQTGPTRNRVDTRSTHAFLLHRKLIIEKSNISSASLSVVHPPLLVRCTSNAKKTRNATDLPTSQAFWANWVIFEQKSTKVGLINKREASKHHKTKVYHLESSKNRHNKQRLIYGSTKMNPCV